jgi:hypothetical protein
MPIIRRKDGTVEKINSEVAKFVFRPAVSLPCHIIYKNLIFYYFVCIGQNSIPVDRDPISEGVCGFWTRLGLNIMSVYLGLRVTVNDLTD